MSGKTKKNYGAAAVFLLLSMQSQPCDAMGPETVVLDSIAQHYKPVTFDHAMHVDLVGEENCARCHHHTVGTPVINKDCQKCHANSEGADSVACIDCHSEKWFDAAYLETIQKDHDLYHAGKPGLKGAFHQNCLGCHEEMGAATGCQDCHERTDAGDKFFRSGNYAPKPSQSKKTSGH